LAGQAKAKDGHLRAAKVGFMIESAPVWHHVYIIENEKGYQYVGSTSDVAKRLAHHNKKSVPSTSKYVPWHLMHIASFPTKEKALIYEKYLKSGSGTMFRYRHLVSNKRRNNKSLEEILMDTNS